MSPTFRSLSNPNYRLYAAGGAVSNVGTWMQRVAQDWLVLQLTAYSGVALVGQAPAQPHDGQAELDGEAGVGAGRLLDRGHVLSLGHYPC